MQWLNSVGRESQIVFGQEDHGKQAPHARQPLLSKLMIIHAVSLSPNGALPPHFVSKHFAVAGFVSSDSRPPLSQLHGEPLTGLGALRPY